MAFFITNFSSCILALLYFFLQVTTISFLLAISLHCGILLGIARHKSLMIKYWVAGLRFLDLRALCLIMSFTLSYHEHLRLYQWVWQSVIPSTLMLNLFHLGLLTSELSAGLKAEFWSILFNFCLILPPQFFVPLLDWCDDHCKKTLSPLKYVF